VKTNAGWVIRTTPMKAIGMATQTTGDVRSRKTTFDRIATNTGVRFMSVTEVARGSDGSHNA
jgi:hypothetical protein